MTYPYYLENGAERPCEIPLMIYNFSRKLGVEGTRRHLHKVGKLRDCKQRCQLSRKFVKINDQISSFD